MQENGSTSLAPSAAQIMANRDGSLPVWLRARGMPAILSFLLDALNGLKLDRAERWRKIVSA
jgi:hypothetical protein